MRIAEYDSTMFGEYYKGWYNDYWIKSLVPVFIIAQLRDVYDIKGFMGDMQHPVNSLTIRLNKINVSL